MSTIFTPVFKKMFPILIYVGFCNMFSKSVNFDDFEKKFWPNFKKLGVLKITRRRA